MPAMTITLSDQTHTMSEASPKKDGIAGTEVKKPGARHGHSQSNCHHLPPPPSQPTAEGEYRCGICNKTYSRRDLRDRHRRRCIKNIGQERQSKRKSCDACAQKKLRCSMTRPSCSRCLQSRRPCVYPQSSVPVQTPSLDDPQDNIASSAGSIHPVPICAGIIPGGTTWALPTYPFDTPSTADELHDISGSSWSPETPTNAELAFHAVNESTMLPMQDASLMNSPPWQDDLHEQSETFGLEEFFPGSLDSCSHAMYMPPTMRSSPVTMVPPTPATLSGDSYAAGGGLNMSSVSPGYFDNIWPDMASNDEENETWRFSTYTHSRTGSGFGQSFLPKTSHHSPGDVGDLYQELFSLLREYPGLALQRQFYSPFLHHELQGYAMQSMGQPLSTTLSSISSYANYLETCDTFDLSMHNGERLAAAEGCVVALHAVCVQQILSLFGDNFATNGLSKLPSLTGDQGHPETPVDILLRMTQRVYKLHEDILRTPHEDETDWRRWKFAESLRRNIFFANIIRTLAGRARRYNGINIDPLDSAILLQLPLPAPEEMWRARSEGEWMIARAQTQRSWARGVDGSMLPALRTLQQLLVLEEVGSVSVTLLLPITRMILACAKLNGASYG
ncbi:C6 zinc finger domain protein [Aspergillus costaricaensis CBS 115574]|uniref:C6 zinc finger domain protein n=1 Tax=Aspergillus costaricaensis CBS 115574 TaxID=1448317 RepID=A0ACD1IEX8_9EURO|nr:C6 zinc finger domain protein [Aspergillus costaricaensis CBS 115574]RAK88798.1 C6 zinc finger domain protein [Aspergillus costaricaensis CBS 115574]